LLDRLISILLKPRESVRLGEYYGPALRGPMLRPKAYVTDPPPAA